MDSSSERFVVIMAGGRGERFWPLSREERPKQHLDLLGDGSLLQQCLARVEGLVPLENVLVITNARQRPQVLEQLPLLPPGNVVAEPCGRDTCAAVVLGAALVGARCGKGAMAVLPADHRIGDPEAFRRTLRDCFLVAQREESLVAIGIEPAGPATGYGYILKGDLLEGEHPGGTAFRRSLRFVEKPDRETAVGYLASGRYVWNAGMFLWSVGALRRALDRHLPAMAPVMERWRRAARSPGELAAVLERDYPSLEPISVDYALMEKAGNVAIADAAFPWDDLGTWDALARHLEADPRGNRLVGDVVSLDSRNNLVYDARSRPGTVALSGVENSIVVLADDAVLVASRGGAERIKDLVRLLAADPDRKALL